MRQKYSTQNSLKSIEQCIKDAAHTEALCFTHVAEPQKRNIVDAIMNYATELPKTSNVAMLQQNMTAELMTNGVTRVEARDMLRRLQQQFGAVVEPDTEVANITYTRAPRYSGRNS